LSCPSRLRSSIFCFGQTRPELGRTSQERSDGQSLGGSPLPGQTGDRNLRCPLPCRFAGRSPQPTFSPLINSSLCFYLIDCPVSLSLSHNYPHYHLLSHPPPPHTHTYLTVDPFTADGFAVASQTDAVRLLVRFRTEPPNLPIFRPQIAFFCQFKSSRFIEQFLVPLTIIQVKFRFLSS
jgi:hypothetical protein